MARLSLSHYRGILVGLGCGDALGGPAEFLPHDQVRRKFGVLCEMVGGGTHDLRPGQITDDTEMALALAASLQEKELFDPDDVLARYRAWYASGPTDVGVTIRFVLRGTSAHLSRREKERAAGSGDLVHDQATPTELAHRYAADFHRRTQGKSAGNGTLMRVAPLSLLYHQHPRLLEEAVREDSHLTHYDPLAADACVAFTRALAAFLNDPDAVLDMNAIGAGLDERVRAALVCEDRLQAAHQANSADGFVLTALTVAFCALNTTTSFEEGVVWAVNLGGDTDTNGAIAGALLGAKYSVNQIPQRWRDVLEADQELLAAADGLFTAALSVA